MFEYAEETEDIETKSNNENDENFDYNIETIRSNVFSHLNNSLNQSKEEIQNNIISLKKRRDVIILRKTANLVRNSYRSTLYISSLIDLQTNAVLDDFSTPTLLLQHKMLDNKEENQIMDCVDVTESNHRMDLLVSMAEKALTDIALGGNNFGNYVVNYYYFGCYLGRKSGEIIQHSFELLINSYFIEIVKQLGEFFDFDELDRFKVLYYKLYILQTI
jgi:hypothetical protein